VIFINKTAQQHYDLLIDEGVDVVYDSKALKAYMNQWTGHFFYDELDVEFDDDILEIGIGTGRIALEVLKYQPRSLTGIDLSKKTINKCKKNLPKSVELFSLDVFDYHPEKKFDKIYSVLTFIHIEKKFEVLKHLKSMLNDDGKIVLALDLGTKNVLDYGIRSIKTYPNRLEEYVRIGKALGFEDISYKLIVNNEREVGLIITYN